MATTHGVTSAPESEEQLIARAQEAISQSRWIVGECAAKWTERYARGRTDGDFAQLIGISPDQVYQRRRVWEVFGPRHTQFAQLKWSHFYAALTWDDAEDCLHWADEMRATVAEMRAWRRAQRGEDLTTEAAAEDELRYLPTELEAVRDPAHFDFSGGRGGAREPGAENPLELPSLAGVARQVGDEGENYTPFRTGAMTPAPAGRGGESSGTPAEPPTTEQIVKRMTTALERSAKLLTPEFRKEFRKLPEGIRERFLEAAAQFVEGLERLK
jgi:hypothetical protein